MVKLGGPWNIFILSEFWFWVDSQNWFPPLLWLDLEELSKLYLYNWSGIDSKIESGSGIVWGSFMLEFMFCLLYIGLCSWWLVSVYGMLRPPPSGNCDSMCPWVGLPLLDISSYDLPVFSAYGVTLVWDVIGHWRNEMWTEWPSIFCK